MSIWAEFWHFTAELPGRQDPLRFYVEALKYANDEQTPPPLLEMPTNFGDRSINNDGAVTAS